MKYSANQFAKAMQNYDSLQEQAQALEQINIDVVDMVNQILNLDSEAPVTFGPCKSVADVKHLVATAALRLRCVVAEMEDAPKLLEDLKEQLSDAEDKVEDLKYEIAELEDEIADLEGG